MKAGPIVAVIGAGDCDSVVAATAQRVGALLAMRGCVVLTGGMGGVMAAASEGASLAGGTVLGILPGPDGRQCNPWVDLPIATGLGDARNALIANTAVAFVAIAGSYGTLSEVAFALLRGKRVISLGSWERVPGVLPARTPEEAVELALEGLPGL